MSEIELIKSIVEKARSSFQAVGGDIEFIELIDNKIYIKPLSLCPNLISAGSIGLEELLYNITRKRYIIIMQK